MRNWSIWTFSDGHTLFLRVSTIGYIWLNVSRVLEDYEILLCLLLLSELLLSNSSPFYAFLIVLHKQQRALQKTILIVPRSCWIAEVFLNNRYAKAQIICAFLFEHESFQLWILFGLNPENEHFCRRCVAQTMRFSVHCVLIDWGSTTLRSVCGRLRISHGTGLTNRSHVNSTLIKIIY